MRKCFQNQFWTLGSASIGKRMKVKVHVFRLGHFARYKIKSEIRFLIKYYIITILFLVKVKKLGFPLYFQILHRRFWVFFQMP